LVRFAGRILYRVGQFWRTLRAKPDSQALLAARAILSPPLMELFLKMQPAEQAHSLKIFCQLAAQGETEPALLEAALLHDSGKILQPLRIWERIAIVLARAFIPGFAKSWGRGQPEGWYRAFVVAEQHPHWGAALASQAGASSLTVALIRRHQDHASGEPESREDQLLRILQALDDAN
jgi:hypothetical protein